MRIFDKLMGSSRSHPPLARRASRGLEYSKWDDQSNVLSNRSRSISARKKENFTRLVQAQQERSIYFRISQMLPLETVDRWERTSHAQFGSMISALGSSSTSRPRKFAGFLIAMNRI